MDRQITAKILGLSEREEKVYLAVLNGGNVSQSDMAKHTGLNRTSLYPQIKSLLLQDLIIQTVVGKRIYYTVENPTKLLKQAQQKFSSLEAMLPSLLETYQMTGQKPKISLHHGPEGLYKVSYEASQKANGYYKAFSSPNNFLSVLKRKDADKIIRLIEKRGVKCYTLSSHTKENKSILPTFSSKNLKWRMLPESIVYPVEFLVYNHTTVITSWSHQFAVVIESEDIKKFVESMFDYFWKIGER